MEESIYLPLGSVVKIRGGIKKFMVISRGMILNIENEKKLVDYGACIFPDGVVSNKVIYFNHTDIAEVIYTGYTDEMDQRMVKNIKKVEKLAEIDHADIQGILDQYIAER